MEYLPPFDICFPTILLENLTGMLKIAYRDCF